LKNKFLPKIPAGLKSESGFFISDSNKKQDQNFAQFKT